MLVNAYEATDAQIKAEIAELVEHDKVYHARRIRMLRGILADRALGLSPPVFDDPEGFPVALRDHEDDGLPFE